MRQALGKGLAALIPSLEEQNNIEKSVENTTQSTLLPIEKIRANRFQPRKHFDPERLSELAASIKEHGLAQPIIVSKDAQNDHYELIAGERRLRACELAGLKEIEAIVRPSKTDKQRLALSLVENLQREDLNAIDQALGYLRLMKEFQISQTDLTQVIGKSKSAISNTLRLLDLPESIQKAIQFSQITEGHARALLMIDNPLKKQELFNKIIQQNLSVRDTEDLARITVSPKNRRGEKVSLSKPADIQALETTLQHLLGTKVEIKTRKDPSKGIISVHFYSLTDFDKLINILKK